MKKFESGQTTIHDSYNGFLSIQWMRVILYLYVPMDVTGHTVGSLLRGKGFQFDPVTLSILHHLHTEDDVLRSWRMRDGESPFPLE